MVKIFENRVFKIEKVAPNPHFWIFLDADPALEAHFRGASNALGRGALVLGLGPQARSFANRGRATPYGSCPGPGGTGRSAPLGLRLGGPTQRTGMGNPAKRFGQPPPESRDMGRGRSVFWPKKSAKNRQKRGSKKGSKNGQKMDKKASKGGAG